MKIDAFYSDPHFGHKGVIEFCSRPYADRDEMNEDLIKRYNEVVPEDGTCVWVGDCFFLNQELAKQIMRRLNGTKILVRGNHDDKPHKMVERGFHLVTDELWLDIAGYPCRVNHFPPAGYSSDARYNARRPPWSPHVLIHGHTHANWKVETKGKGKKMLHVGVDAWDYAPAPYSEVEKLVKAMHDEPNCQICLDACMNKKGNYKRFETYNETMADTAEVEEGSEHIVCHVCYEAMT